MELVAQDLKLFYSKNYKSWDKVKVSLSKDELLIGNSRGERSIDLSGLFINNLKQGKEGKSVITFTHMEAQFFLGGEKETITSLFLKVLHIQSKRKAPLAEPEKRTEVCELEWLHFISRELLDELARKMEPREVREFLLELGHKKGSEIAAKVGKSPIRSAIDAIFKEIGPVCTFKVHSFEVSETSVEINIEISDCLLMDLGLGHASYPSIVYEILPGILEKALLDMTAGREVTLDHWRSNIENKSYTKVTLLLPEEWSDKSTEDKYWKD